MQNKPEKNLFVNVQVLRAIAVALIAMVHMHSLFPNEQAQGFLYRLGYASVDLFFVISGFIMVVTTAARPPSAISFWVHRIRRVVPLYYLATGFVFVVAQVAPSVFSSSSADVSELVKSLLFIPYEKSPGRIYPLYFLGWTLNYEMLFYALFGAALLLWSKRRVLVCSLVILAAVTAGALFEVTPQDNVVLYTYSRPIMLDFVLGMVIGHFYPALNRLGATIDTRLVAAGLVGVALMLLSWLPLSPSPVAPPTNTILSFGIPMTCVLLAMVMLETAGNRISSPLLLESGNASYSLYLGHYFVIGVFVVANRWIEQPFLMAILAFVAVWVTGLVVYRTVEKPLIGLSKQAVSFAKTRSATSMFHVDKQRRRIQAALVQLTTK